MKKQERTLVPSYAEGFKCIGGKCEDSCCIGWDIDIDKQTFRKYCRTKDVMMKERFDEYIYRNEESHSKDVDYGRISIDDSRWCPFLESDKYCLIQRNLGEDSLSNVCYSFPRVYNILDGISELSLDMSCPEAVRQLLSSENPIILKERNMPRVKRIINGSINTGDKYWNKSPVRKLSELRSLSIRIIQNRAHSINERLLELGSRLEKMADSDLNAEEGLSEAAGIPGSFSFRLEFFAYVIESLGDLNEIDSPVFSDFTTLVMEKISRSDSGWYEEVVVNVVKPFTDEYAYIFEHYLVNFIYQNNFPFSENQDMFDGYIMLVVRYGLIQFYLAGIAAENGKLTIDDVALLIQAHTKIINHHKTFISNLMQEIKRKQYDSMEIISLLVE